MIKTGRSVRLICLTWPRTLRKNSVGSWYKEGHGLVFLWSSSIDTHIKTLGNPASLTNIWQDFLDGALWHSSNSQNHHLRDVKPWDPNYIPNNYRPYTSWHDGQCDQHQCATLLSRQMGKTALRKRSLTGTGPKWLLTIKVCHRVMRGFMDNSRDLISTLT